MHDPRLGAYRMGQSIWMVRYCMAYLWRFRDFYQRTVSHEDPVALLADRVACLRSDVEDIHGYLDPSQPPLLASQMDALEGVANHIGTAFTSPDDLYDSTPFGYGVCPGETEWRLTLRTTEDLFKEKPWLERWRVLGYLLGQCHMALLTGGCEASVPKIKALLQTAAEMPEHLRDRIPLLQKCASALANTPSWLNADVFNVLYNVVDLHPTNPEPVLVGTVDAALRGFDSILASSIYDQLERVELHLHQADTHFYAVLNDMPYEVDVEGFLVLQALQNAGGTRLTSEVINKKCWPKQVSHRRIDRIVDRLPQPLQNLIDSGSGHHGGYLLRLD